MTKRTSYGMDETISAAARILALESDVTQREMFHSRPSKENENLGNILSDIKLSVILQRENVFCKMF
jgi:hypothetical protein